MGHRHCRNAYQYAENFIPELKYFGLRSANFLGSNTGAAFIAAFADVHPDMVRSLILEGPTIWNVGGRGCEIHQAAALT